MIVVMTPRATEAEIDVVRTRLQAHRLHLVVMRGELMTAIGAPPCSGACHQGMREAGAAGPDRDP
jgi:hypothetical protein